MEGRGVVGEDKTISSPFCVYPKFQSTSICEMPYAYRYKNATPPQITPLRKNSVKNRLLKWNNSWFADWITCSIKRYGKTITRYNFTQNFPVDLTERFLNHFQVQVTYLTAHHRPILTRTSTAVNSSPLAAKHFRAAVDFPSTLESSMRLLFQQYYCFYVGAPSNHFEKPCFCIFSRFQWCCSCTAGSGRAAY